MVVYIILGMLYESYIHPLTILSTLPSAGVGALLMLWAFHFDLSVIALIGIILLIGIVKKNGIMMVDFAIQAEREQHLSPEESIRQACLLRFRPIMMTTMAALLAALPLMLGHGTGSELRQPLGYTMVGGLILSQMLTLFTTPVVYLYLDRFSKRLGRVAKAASPRTSGAGRPTRAGDRLTCRTEAMRGLHESLAGRRQRAGDTLRRQGTAGSRARVDNADNGRDGHVSRRQRAVRRDHHGPDAAGPDRRAGHHRGAAQSPATARPFSS